MAEAWGGRSGSALRAGALERLANRFDPVEGSNPTTNQLAILTADARGRLVWRDRSRILGKASPEAPIRVLVDGRPSLPNGRRVNQVLDVAIGASGRLAMLIDYVPERGGLSYQLVKTGPTGLVTIHEIDTGSVFDRLLDAQLNTDGDLVFSTSTAAAWCATTSPPATPSSCCAPATSCSRMAVSYGSSSCASGRVAGASRARRMGTARP